MPGNLAAVRRLEPPATKDCIRGLQGPPRLSSTAAANAESQKSTNERDQTSRRPVHLRCTGGDDSGKARSLTDKQPMPYAAPRCWEG
jgi:hypothetical protein